MLCRTLLRETSPWTFSPGRLLPSAVWPGPGAAPQSALRQGRGALLTQVERGKGGCFGLLALVPEQDPCLSCCRLEGHLMGATASLLQWPSHWFVALATKFCPGCPS